VTPCPLCRQAATDLWTVDDRNRAVTDEDFTYMRCSVCAAISLRDPPADLGRYYPDDYYPLQSTAELEHHAPSEQHKVDLLLSAGGAPGPLTEIGPGQGVFAFAAKRAGFIVTGIEMDAKAVAHLSSVVGVDAVQSVEPHVALAALPPQGAVALWHVIEHLRDPWALVSAAAAVLEPGGLLALSTPNPESLGARVLGRRWPHVDAPRHLFLLPLATLTRYAESVGLQRTFHTTDDPGGRHWNRFAWEYALRGPQPSAGRARAASVAGLAATAAALPLERRPGRGAAYTVVFRKNGPS
jgi:SAM-dependent methyltransferase